MLEYYRLLSSGRLAKRTIWPFFSIFQLKRPQLGLEFGLESGPELSPEHSGCTVSSNFSSHDQMDANRFDHCYDSAAAEGRLVETENNQFFGMILVRENDFNMDCADSSIVLTLYRVLSSSS